MADNLTDDVLLMDPATGAIQTRFDLAENDAVPSTYPIALAVTEDGTRAFVALWNASEVVELDLLHGTVARKLPLLKPSTPTAPGTHPCALEISPDGATMYVALANRDAVAAIDLARGHFAVRGYFDTRLPGQSYFGAIPEALAVAKDGRRLYVGNGATDAVAVLDTTRLTPRRQRRVWSSRSASSPPSGCRCRCRSPAESCLSPRPRARGPDRITCRRSLLLDRSRDPPDGVTSPTSGRCCTDPSRRLILLPSSAISSSRPGVVIASNRLKAAEEKIRFAGGGDGSRIKHVIYIIKENRTYDQVFGDLERDGKPVGNGDRSLTMYGQEITPNQHRMALQFGVLDNFFDSGEVSGDGHVWSNAAIGTDYLEKTWQQSYRGSERTYDFEGVVAEGYPLEQHIPDVNEPSSGYLWGNLARHGKTLYHFGEYIASTFCTEKRSENPQDGPMLEAAEGCARKEIAPGEALPEAWGGGTSKWPWAIPVLARNIPTKPELVGHFAAEQPDFNLKVPDQIRADVFLRHFDGWVKDRAAGHDTMPNFVMLRLANDHTAGTTPGSPTPRASVADNDLAIGRAVDAVSHSPFWDDTAFFILEDDAQNGADHVDAHRSLALVVSKYAPQGADGRPFVDSRFYSTVSMIRTMETVLGLPPMNNNDAFSSMMSPEFSGPGDQPPFAADYVNRDNKLIYAMNTPRSAGAKQSSKMDFRHADRADARKLNVILWKDAMGDRDVPTLLTEKRKKATKDDDDD